MKKDYIDTLQSHSNSLSDDIRTNEVEFDKAMLALSSASVGFCILFFRMQNSEAIFLVVLLTSIVFHAVSSGCIISSFLFSKKSLEKLRESNDVLIDYERFCDEGHYLKSLDLENRSATLQKRSSLCTKFSFAFFLLGVLLLLIFIGLNSKGSWLSKREPVNFEIKITD